MRSDSTFSSISSYLSCRLMVARVTMVALLMTITLSLNGQVIKPLVPHKRAPLVDTLAFKPNAWTGAWMSGGINLAVWSFDRYIMKEDWAKITPSSVVKNMVRGFRWDSDGLETNMFAHPYHGSLYYNAARSNGMSYWQSIPYTVLGSATWELIAETEPASINDFWATSMGGLALGEITHRLSYRIIDRSTTGWERAGREVAAAVINPVGMLSRLVNGELGGVAKRGYHRPYRDDEVNLKVGLGANFISESYQLYKGGGGMVLDLGVRYNDPFELDYPVPYEHFKFDLSINPVGSQPLIGRMNILALLAGRSYTPFEGHKMVIGAFQHLSYHDSKSGIKGSDVIPFKLASAASFGTGMLYNLQNSNKSIDLRFGINLNGIILGGSASDYGVIGDRDYNFGSGFSTLINTELTFINKASFYLSMENYMLYTWKGYNPNGSYDRLAPELYNVQGDKSNTIFTIINPRLEIMINRTFSFQINSYIHLRHTNYRHLPDVFFNTYETKAGLICRL
ncbi:MAG: DUF3943 domain-containing protein [Bacteroidales bacterium]